MNASSFFPVQQIAAALARIRGDADLTQAVVAEKAGLDQSRISRIEKGEVSSPGDVDRFLDALVELGAPNSAEYKAYAAREWQHIEPPSFWNSERACLELAEETLGQIETFIHSADPPWPLRRQLERHRKSLLRASTFLTRQNHSIGFIGDMGVGKSTAICFLFDLLVPPTLTDKQINRPILETGGGGTTICEVHVKAGPQFGISLVPMNENEHRQLVADFCAAKWMLLGSGQRETTETVGVSAENDRAIRNMSGLWRRRETKEGKVSYHDPVTELARASASEDEFRTRVLALIGLADRTRRELLVRQCHAEASDGMGDGDVQVCRTNRSSLKDVPLPRSIDLFNSRIWTRLRRVANFCNRHQGSR